MAASEVTRKLALAFNIPLHQINQVYRQGPTGIHILVSDQVIEIFFLAFYLWLGVEGFLMLAHLLLVFLFDNVTLVFADI